MLTVSSLYLLYTFRFVMIHAQYLSVYNKGATLNMLQDQVVNRPSSLVVINNCIYYDVEGI